MGLTIRISALNVDCRSGNKIQKNNKKLQIYNLQLKYITISRISTNRFVLKREQGKSSFSNSNILVNFSPVGNEEQIIQMKNIYSYLRSGTSTQ
jgi:hypothetical protein